MLARSTLGLILSAMCLVSASAEPGIGGTVTVETDLAHKSESAAPKKERRADRIWSGVIMATNPEEPKPIPKELRPFEASLKRMFGYNQFEIVGTATEPIDEETEHWLLPVHSFSLQVNARRAVPKDERGGYLLDIQLFQVRRALVKAEAKLAPDRSPLIIRGPECGKGEIIIILMVEH
jgi:hypothetical protein